MKHYHIVSRISIYLLSIVMIILGFFIFKSHDLLVYVPASLPWGHCLAYFVGAAFILVGIALLPTTL